MIRFRRLHKCQNGHENYLYFELHGETLGNFKWGEAKCDCPKYLIGEGYTPITDTEIVYSDYPLESRDIPQKPIEETFEGENIMACPTCGNWQIGKDKYCADCGQRLDHEFETHENYSGV